MRARTEITVAAGGRLERLDCQPPLTIRRVHADDPGCCALCLVGTAAGPLAGDRLELDLVLRDGARATLQATGASLAQGAGGNRTMITTATLGDGARLDAVPQPMIVAAGSRVDLAVSIALGTGAAIDWQELLVLGRTAEAPGAATLRWDVTRSGRPVLRQHVDLTDLAWHGLTGGHRVLATAFVSRPDLDARTVVASPTSVAARLDEHTVLMTILGDDVATVRAQLTALRTASVQRSSGTHPGRPLQPLVFGG